jgi:hypothetical protein
MAMAELKTKATTQSATNFLSAITPADKKADSLELLKIFEEVTGEKAVMWGTSIIGFGKYHYKSERSSQEGDWPLVAFSPRKQNLTLYIMHGNTASETLFKKLGKHKTSSGSCLYINKLSDVDQNILKKLIKISFDFMKKEHHV